MTPDNTQLDPLSEKVLGAVFEAANTLDAGFLEKVFERAPLRELGLRGMRARRGDFICSDLPGALVREYFADLLVEDALGRKAVNFQEAQSRAAAESRVGCRRVSDTAAGTPGLE